jgi:intracellular sulfur oxidation DsrE/DsrF family protein
MTPAATDRLESAFQRRGKPPRSFDIDVSSDRKRCEIATQQQCRAVSDPLGSETALGPVEPTPPGGTATPPARSTDPAIFLEMPMIPCSRLPLAAAAMMLVWNIAAVNAAPAGYYTDQKVVYHNDGGGPDNATYFKRMLTNIKNHVDAVGKDHVEIRVIDHGAGVDLFQIAQDDATLAGRLDALRAQGVRFLICANTLVERQIDWHSLYGVEEDDVVPSGAAELARLQGMGFVYIHP